MNFPVLVGTILFHVTGISLFIALIVELWRYFIDKTMSQMQSGQGKVDARMWNQVERYSILRGVFQTDQTLRSSDEASTKEQRRRHWYLRKQKIINGFLIGVHYLVWGIKLLLPNFLVGSPSLFDNVKVILLEPRFKPLRIFIGIWFLLVIAFLVVIRMII